MRDASTKECQNAQEDIDRYDTTYLANTTKHIGDKDSLRAML